MKGALVMANSKEKQFQKDYTQYEMNNVLKQPKIGHYKVGYGATTGNNTDEGKKTT